MTGQMKQSDKFTSPGESDNVANQCDESMDLLNLLLDKLSILMNSR